MFLLVIWSPKQSKFEESYLESMAKQWKAQKHKDPKFWSFKVLCNKQSRMQGGEVKRISAMKHSWWQSGQPLLEHFLKSNLCMLYSFRRLGSQQSNASNGSWIGVEMKKLEPLEVDHSKLKANFAGLRNQPLAAKWFRSHPVCLRNFASILCACEILMSASRYLRPTLFDILLQIFDV